MYRTFRSPSIWREMARFQRDMNRLFSDFSGSRVRTASSYPAINIWVNQDGQVIRAEMPGVRAEDIDISVDGDSLSINGVRRIEELPEGARHLRQERGFGKFSRSIQLPFAVDTGKVKAIFKDGILDISLPRAEVDKPQKITIKS